jgi:hypothetical protein
MTSKKLITIIFLSSFLLSGCSLIPGNKTPAPTPTPQAAQLTPETAPFATLTITADKKTGGISGHTFTMNLSNLSVQAKSIEYLLLYDLPDGRQQGIPGTIDLSGKTTITRDDLLMGSCSKVCRFDDGVTKGTIQLTYRDASGGSVGDILGDWHLQAQDKKLTSVDGAFEFQPSKKTAGWFVTMTSLGLPAKIPEGKLIAGPYTVTASTKTDIPGTVSFRNAVAGSASDIYYWNTGNWEKLPSSQAPSVSTFILVSPQ